MISHDIGVDQVVEVARLILEGAIRDGDAVTFDGNDFPFNGKSDKKAA